MRPIVYLSYKIMALMMSVFALFGSVISPGTDQLIKADDADLTFIAWADTQVSNYMFERENVFKAACKDIENSGAVFDALVVAGDISENGLESEYAVVADGFNSITRNVKNFLLATGNHDVRLKAFPIQLAKFTSFNNNVRNAVRLDGKKYYYSYEINGYKFIVLGTEKSTFEEAYFSDTQLSWLQSEIASADRDKPVFVICHQPLQNTHGLPGTWNAPEILKAGSVGNQGDALKDIFNRFNNVVYITGHLHTGFGVNTVEKIENFYSVNLPAIGPSNADGCEDDGQGYIFSVNGSRITAKARTFAGGIFRPEYDFEIAIG